MSDELTPEAHAALRRELAAARREAVYGVARVAGSFANDLAEAREGLRILMEAIELHLSHFDDPSGELAAALRAIRPRGRGAGDR